MSLDRQYFSIYDPVTKKWSSAGLGSSGINRMYHSSAILLPDGEYLSQRSPSPIYLIDSFEQLI